MATTPIVYPFAGRLVNGALGTLIGYRLGRERPLTLRVTPNDYGVELFSSTRRLMCDEARWRELLAPDEPPRLTC
jgi:Lhr-like helicase